jgi:hypothetical protein
MRGDAWWAVRIDNASNKVTTILGVTVTAIDTDGFEVPDGCLQVDQAFDNSIRSVLSESLDTALDRHLDGAIKQTIRDVLSIRYDRR